MLISGKKQFASVDVVTNDNRLVFESCFIVSAKREDGPCRRTRYT